MSISIRGLSLHQPYASAMALGMKRLETRSRTTTVRGVVLLHAATRQAPADDPVWEYMPLSVDDLPSGAVVALGNLVGSYRAEELPPHVAILRRANPEHSLGDFSPGRFVWEFDDVVALPEPVACKGAQGFWLPSHETLDAIEAQLPAMRGDNSIYVQAMRRRNREDRLRESNGD